MKRNVTVGPEQIKATFSVLTDHLGKLRAYGVPDTAKVRIVTSAAGDALTVSVDYEEEAETQPQAAVSGT